MSFAFIYKFMFSLLSLLFFFQVSMHLTALTVNGNDAVLMFSAMIWRHGDRTPMRDMSLFPKDHNTFPIGPGQLTRTGMEQEYNLGVHLHTLYSPYISSVNDYRFDDIYVFSADVERVLESAQCVMRGLFNDSRPYPVHSVQKKDDFFVRAFDKGKCPILDRWNTVEKYKTTEWIETEARVSEDMKLISNAYGYQYDELKDMGYVFDLINVEHAHGLSYPAGMDEQLVNVSLEMHAFEMKIKVGTPTIAKYIVSPLMHDILNYIDDIILDKKEKRHLAGYSGHDTTIAELLKAFENYDTNIPYSSCIRFELYHHSSSNEYTIQMIYNDRALPIPTCSSIDCRYDEFVAYITNFFPKNTTAACSISPADNEESPFPIVFLYICIMVIVLLAVPFVYYYFRNRRHKVEYEAQLLEDTA